MFTVAYRNNPDLSLPNLIWCTGSAIVRLYGVVATVGSAIPGVLRNLYLLLVSAVLVVLTVAAKVASSKMFRFALVAAALVAVVVALALLVQAYPLVFVGGGLIAAFAFVFKPRNK